MDTTVYLFVWTEITQTSVSIIQCTILNPHIKLFQIINLIIK